jgi:hypothetical protein
MPFLVLGGFLLEGMRSDAELVVAKTFAVVDRTEFGGKTSLDAECDAVLEGVELSGG